MVIGESPEVNRYNLERRNFVQGDDQVLERQTYDHVGVTCCLGTK